MFNKTDEYASKFLGKRVEGAQTYDPSFIVAIPRYENRQQYNIEDKSLPFVGYDVWHAYEFSSMTENGLPVTRLMKMRYSCNSEFLVESKSLKLYLNSFNMSKFGKTVDECLDICKKIISKDLSEKLQTDVAVNFLKSNSQRIEIYQNFQDLTKIINEKDLVITDFKESPELLKIENKEDKKEYSLMFDSLRSNCRVTHQPDFGDVFIYYNSKKHILEDSLVKYLCSFRCEYHFHEECCEMIFKRLIDKLDSDDDLFVSILYTRRGGIDISPSRWTKNFDYKDVKNLLNLECYARNGIKQ